MISNNPIKLPPKWESICFDNLIVFWILQSVMGWTIMEWRQQLHLYLAKLQAQTWWKSSVRWSWQPKKYFNIHFFGRVHCAIKCSSGWWPCNSDSLLMHLNILHYTTLHYTTLHHSWQKQEPDFSERICKIGRRA